MRVSEIQVKAKPEEGNVERLMHAAPIVREAKRPETHFFFSSLAHKRLVRKYNSLTTKNSLVKEL